MAQFTCEIIKNDRLHSKTLLTLILILEEYYGNYRRKVVTIS